jgi:imidazoleglycerol-phosphate dehydratase
VTRAGAATIVVDSGAESRIETGVAVLDHLLQELASAGRLTMALELAPADPEAEVGEAGLALARALTPLLANPAARGRGLGVAPADEALAMVVVERSARPLVVSNADLSSSRAGGLRADLASTFIDALANEASLTIHVRLIEGESSEHVLSAIFKALGIALAETVANQRGA